MADIVGNAQVVGGKIGFIVIGNDLFGVGTLNGRLVGVDKVGVLLADRLHHLKECRGVEKIIVIEQGNILTRRHVNAGVGVLGDTEVLFQLLVKNARIL